MEVIKVKDYGELSQFAATRIESQVKRKPASVLGLATGGTPLGTYKELVKGYENGNTDYHQVTTFNLDEYVGLDPEHPQSYHTYMHTHLFNHININPDQIHLPKGNTRQLAVECKEYEHLIEEVGPPDLQLLGIGENGHIGFNEPGTPFSSTTHIVDLTTSTKKANARF
ncbi:glucosamine-6-phosphate deaminase, partial [Halobacillus sp. BBL2006]|uniref:glucosamine-6-phosphate deaminase n=1 Tax=Halobacillus sp. BBL2006 TaxID=1543706 RepID=UPI000544082A